MYRRLRLASPLLAAIFAVGCASQWDPIPPVEDHHCRRFQETPAGTVGAEAFPDHRGGYRSFSMTWRRRAGPDSLGATAYWGQGRSAISPPGWLTVSMIMVERVPPQGATFRLQLSSGERREELLSLPKEMRRREASPNRFGASVLVRDMAFIEKFTQAAWMDITLADSAGVVYAQARLDLTGVPEAVRLMRDLGDEVLEDLADYRNRCAAMEHTDISEII